MGPMLNGLKMVTGKGLAIMEDWNLLRGLGLSMS